MKEANLYIDWITPIASCKADMKSPACLKQKSIFFSFTKKVNKYH